MGECGSGDPAPEAFLVEASTREALLAGLASRLPATRADVVGGAVIATPRGFRAVLLRAVRRARVDAVPDRVPVGATIRIAGELLGDLGAPQLFVEDARGEVVPLSARVDGRRFEAVATLRAAGRYVLELMGRGRAGPTVAWLLRVGVGMAPGGVAASGQRVGLDEPSQARAVFDAINGLRLRQGEAALALDPALCQLAEGYSREMRDRGFFAHVSPFSGDLRARLSRARYRFASAGENLAEGKDALSAHALAEESPAHRRNLLDPGYDRCGVGVAWSRDPAGDPLAIVTEIFAGG